MSKRNPPRSKAQIERDRRRIADMYLSGKLQADIGAELGLSQATVSNDLKALHDEWRRDALRDIGEIKSRELARIDRLEREAWEAWERSRLAAETTIQEQSETPQGTTKKARKLSKGQSGDPRYLATVQWCVEQRMKIFGIYEATKIHITSWQDEVVAALQEGRLSAEDVRALYPDLAVEFFQRANIEA